MKNWITVSLGWLVLISLHGHLLAAPFVPERNAQVVAVSRDGKLVATGKSGMSNSEFPPRPHPTVRKCALIQIWNAQTGEMLHRMQSFGDFTQLKFSPDGKRLASCRLFSPDGKLEMSEVHVYNVATGKTEHVFNRCHAFDFAPDGAIVVLSRSKCVLYGGTSFTKQAVYEPLGRSLTVAITADGTRVMAVKQVAEGFCIRSCDRKTGKLLTQSPAVPHPFYQLVVAPNNGFVATGHRDGTVLLWRQEELQPFTRLQASTAGRQFPFISPDSRYVGAGNQTSGDVVIWDLTSGEQSGRMTFERGTFHTYHPRNRTAQIRPEDDPARFVFMPDGATFLAGCFGGMIRSVNSGQELKRFSY
ncbi:MAG TPA: hypothetical protein DCY79_12050 [Planctomycetaceae bacterium]|nr:hypothetical protein [Blastopirellula sp.]HAY80529.1 hypothetical protein [Planctomycetaceae bacterium]|tara:strand:+ start:332 stop:1408 length:1077 start_codon:yes stop_codon:yes gene_type:complete